MFQDTCSYLTSVTVITTICTTSSWPRNKSVLHLIFWVNNFQAFLFCAWLFASCKVLPVWLGPDAAKYYMSFYGLVMPVLMKMFLTATLLPGLGPLFFGILTGSVGAWACCRAILCAQLAGNLPLVRPGPVTGRPGPAMTASSQPALFAQPNCKHRRHKSQVRQTVHECTRIMTSHVKIQNVSIPPRYTKKLQHCCSSGVQKR